MKFKIVSMFVIFVWMVFLFKAIICDNIDINNPQVAEQLYTKLFKQRRAEQLEAVKSFQKITNYDKQYSLIFLMCEKIFTVVLDSRAQIEASGFIPGTSHFPDDEKTRNALSNILENTALFSEILLRFPDITTTVLKLNNNWDILLQWSITFANEVRYLLDNSTIRLLRLVGQELNHTQRDPDYINPYRKVAKSNNVNIGKDPSKVDKKKKRKEIKKGPRLYVNEL